MEDQNQVGRDHWKGRSSSWTATAAQGLSTDDTLNQMLIELTGIAPGERVLDLGSGTGDPTIRRSASAWHSATAVLSPPAT